MTPAKVLSWWATVCEKIFILVTAPLRQPKNLISLLQGNLEDMDIAKYDEAHDILTEAKTKWNRIVGQVVSVPDCQIFTNYEASKKRKPENDGDAAAKKAKLAADKEKSAADKAAKAEHAKAAKRGCIVYKASGAMPMIDEADPKKRMCGGFHRDGVICRHPNCPMRHELDPTKWEPTCLKKWNDLIEATSAMSWHDSVDVAKIKSIISGL